MDYQNDTLRQLVSLSRLPSEMRVQSSIGDATASVAENVSESIKAMLPQQLIESKMKSEEQSLKTYKMYCSTFGIKPDEKHYKVWLEQQ